MAKGSNNTRKTRKTRQELGEEKIIKDKFERQRIEEINSNPLKPWNELQAQYIRELNTKSMVIATGFAGTSKTYIPTVMACDALRTGQINKIYLTRPNISNSKSLGFFGGSLEEKAKNWLGPVLSIMYDRLGLGAVDVYIRNEEIAFVPFEVIKGWSFSDAWVICDEAEDMTEEEAKKIVTRIGKNSKLCLAGDITQSELKEKNGLRKLIDMVESGTNPELEDTVGIIDFNRPSDIVRSELCKSWILAFHREEGVQ